MRALARTAELLDLVVGRGEIRQRHRNGDGFLAEVLERQLQLLSRSHRGQQVGRDRAAGEATAAFAGLDLQVGDLAVIDLEFGAARQIESERQLHRRDRRMGVAGHADVDEDDQLAGLGEHGGLLDRAFERRVAAGAGASRGPAGRGAAAAAGWSAVRRCRCCGRGRRALGLGACWAWPKPLGPSAIKVARTAIVRKSSLIRLRD